jgi:uncharacterized membrane protein YedE/YeeE
MTIANFTPVSAAIGGALIGLSAALLMLLIGRIAGISSIFSGMLLTSWRDQPWRIAFMIGLVGAPALTALAGLPLAAPAIPDGWGIVALAGLLVGFGTRLGGGCTSGHGVCGIARLSVRSIVATCVFMAVAIIVVAARRHVIGG